MSRLWAPSKAFTLSLAFLLGGCGYLHSWQLKTGLTSFRIKDIQVDSSSGELVVHWSRASGIDTYRAWISRTSRCTGHELGMAAESTSLNFGRVGPGTYFACVEAVPEPKGIGSNTCNIRQSSVSGEGYAARNQGKAFTIAADRAGSWRRIADNLVGSTLVGNQGATLVETNEKLLALDTEGQILAEAGPLEPESRSASNTYVYAQGFLALVQTLQETRLLRWDDNEKIWQDLTRFPQQSLLGVQLVNPDELIFVLLDKDKTTATWLSLNPADPAVIQTQEKVSLTTQTGLALYNFASIYVDGSFIIADNRGFVRLTRSGLETLLSETGMSPLRIFRFPGAADEFLVLSRFLPLHATSASLLCSFAPVPAVFWYSWNSATGVFREVRTEAYEGFLHALREGPVAMSYGVAGSFLEAKSETPLTYTEPPFREGRLLDGPQLPKDQLLVANGKELWLFTPDSP